MIKVEAGDTGKLFIDEYFEIVPAICPFETSLATASTPGMLPDSGMTFDTVVHDDIIFLQNWNTEPGPGDYKVILYGDSRSQYIEDTSERVMASVPVMFMKSPIM